MLFSYNWLQSYFKKNLPSPNKLADLLSLHSFEVENVEEIDGDYVLSVDILPNRAGDCMSHDGMAREIGAMLSITPEIKRSSLKLQKGALLKDILEVSVVNNNDCPRYMAIAINGVEVKESPLWIQERLNSCGLRAINSIVDAVNYTMLETGQPLHAFDAEKIEGKKIIVRRANDGERIITLDGGEYELDKDVLVIADAVKPLVVAGIKGGKDAEVIHSTKNIILEAANFDLSLIRKVSQKLALRTDSSVRFGQGLDPNLAEEAIIRASELIAKTCGGKIIKQVGDIYPRKFEPLKLKIEYEKITKSLGVEIPTEKILKIFNDLGFNAKMVGKSSFSLLAPTIRKDIVIEEDLVEEIGRIYGYDKIKSESPMGHLKVLPRNEKIFYRSKTRNILAGLGFSEVYNYSFIGEDDAVFFDEKNSLVELKNPISEDKKYMRPNLLVNLLKNTRDNLRFFDEFRLFEIGKINKEKESEKERLGGVIMNTAVKANELFFLAKGAINLILESFGLSDIWYDDHEVLAGKIFFPGRCAEVKIGDKLLGFIGEIHPETREKYGIKKPVVCFELDFDLLGELATEEIIYTAPSKYPAVVRDVAVLTPIGVKSSEIINIIETIGGELVTDIDLFDIYEGENIPTGVKSLAFHVIYQSYEKTLTDKEVDAIHSRLMKSLEDKGWEVRK